MSQNTKYGINRLLTSCEIVTVDRNISLIGENGDVFPLDRVIEVLSAEIEACYPDAYNALAELYAESRHNRPFYMKRIVSRFVRCNFSPADNKPDIRDGSFCNFEYVPCPLRGECRLEGIVCNPRFSPTLRASETRVMRLWFEGYDETDIANELNLSAYTVHNHIRNAYARLGVHSRSEFIRHAVIHNLFS